MKLLQQKRNALYKAISDQIMTLRIDNQNRKDASRTAGEIIELERMDNKLFRLENDIWNNVHAVLNLEGPA